MVHETMVANSSGFRNPLRHNPSSAQQHPSALPTSESPPSPKAAQNITDVHSVPFCIFAGGLLNLVSGCINAICMVGTFTETITHMTGTTTALGADFERGDWIEVAYQGAKIASFVVGSALSGSYLGVGSPLPKL